MVEGHGAAKMLSSCREATQGNSAREEGTSDQTGDNSITYLDTRRSVPHLSIP